MEGSYTRKTTRPCTAVLLTLFSLGLVAVSAACGGSDNPPAPPAGPTLDHSQIVLLDDAGTPLTVASTKPYSPRRTCGACHDVDEISAGYHFQQGRTDAAGTFEMKDDYFNDGRDFLQSAGMYGKW